MDPMPIAIEFHKTGKEIKTAIQKRRDQLQQRLERRNKTLEEFLKDSKKVRSYMVRSSAQNYGGHYGGRGATLYANDEVSSEEMQEISQLCQRIFEIEQELHRLSLIAVHLSDDAVFELSFEDLIGYGFDTSLNGD
jgi:hypothetical protein